jgi:N-succinyldiaminopimelate aminotransferase
VNPFSHPSSSAFRSVPRTGVIFVMAEAAQRGYTSHNPTWCNFGQGQPETGPLPNAPPRIENVSIPLDDNEYAPVAGLHELREAVAHLYNHMYRKGLPSQYTAENVCICGGGRLSLTRAAASLGNVNLGHFLPDYTAYEELLEVFRTFTPIPILLEASEGYAFTVGDLRKEILGRGLGALLLSNPCNPTGKVIQGETLAAWVRTARSLDCSLLIDEFYSNYIWTHEGNPTHTVSAARYVEDVNKDPVVIFNGLTKNWRYPGWRTSWIVGPKTVIDAVSSAGSFLDGGGSRPLQRAALPLLDPAYVQQETSAIHHTFAHKRTVLLEGLQRLGISVDIAPEGTFYVWGNVQNLPGPLSDGMEFFKHALDHHVITVPGEFFDINPGKRRPGHASRYKHYARFSFGPELASLNTGLQHLSEMIHG